jgi:CDP-glycerol glycerophosphotransferase (TagB/SpsB family)
VVVNLYSTIALEACLFDKPIINMWYFGSVGMTVQQPIYIPYPEIHHIRKFESYGAAEKATTREELIDLIHQAIENPEQGAEQRSLAVTKELGPLDGKVKDRLVDFCCSSASGMKSANQMRAA